MSTDLVDHRPLHGDPARLTAAAAVLRAGDAAQIFGDRLPGEFVMFGVAQLLEAVAARMQEHADIGHSVVSAATGLAEHVLAYVPTEGQQR